VFRYGHSAGNTAEENSSVSNQTKCASCHQQRHAERKTLFQQNPLVLKQGCQATHFVIYNDSKMVAVILWKMSKNNYQHAFRQLTPLVQHKVSTHHQEIPDSANHLSLHSTTKQQVHM